MANLLQTPVFAPEKSLASDPFIRKTFYNPRSGHHFTIFEEKNEALLQHLAIELVYPAHSKEPPAHYHPAQTEYFTLLKGEMKVRMDGMLQTLKAGDILIVPPARIHSMWNDGETPAVLRWTVSPAFETERLFETLAELARTGKTDQEGRPRLLYSALFFRRFRRELRLAQPSLPVQAVVFGFLAWLACFLGYRLPELKPDSDRQKTDSSG